MSTATSVTPGTDAVAARTSRSIASAAGQPTMVSLMPTAARPAASTDTASTMSSSVMGLRISGSSTAASAPRTASESPEAESGTRSGTGLFALARLALLEVFEQGAQLGADEVLGRHVAHGQA